MKIECRFLFYPVTMWLLGSSPCGAITWRPSMTDTAPNTDRNVSTISRNLAAQSRFNGTGIITFGGTGALISPEWVLTARHVVNGQTGGAFIYHGGSSNIASIHVMPDSDVALVRLTTPVTKSGVPSTPIYQGSDEVGKEIWLAGYGLRGEFTGNAAELAGSNGIRYAATNRITGIHEAGGVGGQTLVFKYDTGSSALPNEGATAPGDSGGPMFMEEGGRLWIVGETLGAAAGVGFMHGRVSHYKDWIRSTTGINFNEATWDANSNTAGIQQGNGIWSTASSATRWQFQDENFQWSNGYDVIFEGNGNAATVTLDTPVTAASIAFNSAGYTVSSPSHVLNLAPAAKIMLNEDATIQAPISGGAILKNGAANLILEGANSFGGQLTVNAGKVRISDNNGLGKGSGETLLKGGNNRAGVEFTGGISSAEPFTLEMQNASSHVQLLGLDGNNTLSGAISLTTGGNRWDIGSLAGRLDITGPVTSIVTMVDSDRTLSLRGPGAGSLSGAISDSSSGSKVNLRVGSGDWALRGSAKSYTGDTTATATSHLRVNCRIASPINVEAGAAFSGTGSTSETLVIRKNAVFSRPLTNWTAPGAAFSADSLSDPSSSSWTLRLESDDLVGFTETPKTVPLISSVSSLPAINTGKITLEVVGFTGKGQWAISKTQNALNLVYTPDPYLSWATTIAWNGRDSSAAADPDSDGLANLLEFALGSSPIAASPVASPVVGVVAGNNLEFRFFRARSELTYLVRASSDLKNWTTVATNPGSVGQNVTYIAPAPTPPGRVFYRLQVQEN